MYDYLFKSNILLHLNKPFWKISVQKKSLLSWILAWNIRRKCDSEFSKYTVFTFRTKLFLLGSTQLICTERTRDACAAQILWFKCLLLSFFSVTCTPALICSSSEALFQSCRTEGYHGKGRVKRENNPENEGLRKLCYNSCETWHKFLLENLNQSILVNLTHELVSSWDALTS